MASESIGIIQAMMTYRLSSRCPFLHPLQTFLHLPGLLTFCTRRKPRALPGKFCTSMHFENPFT